MTTHLHGIAAQEILISKIQEIDLSGDDITISDQNFGGSSSMENGDYRAFYARLNSRQLKALAPNVPYAIKPVNKSEKYFWTVNDGVALVKPIFYGDLILAALNNTIHPGISLNGGDRHSADYVRPFKWCGSSHPTCLQLIIDY